MIIFLRHHKIQCSVLYKYQKTIVRKGERKNMNGYKVLIEESSKDLTARERLMLKDTSDALKIDELTEDDGLIISPDAYAVLNVHNEKSENKEYHVYLIIDKNGTKYVTGSESFWSSFIEIWEDMTEAGEEFEIKCYKLDSKNYKGKKFLTCSII